ncbi:MAG: hypothetical protein FWF53_03400 [Candidatus Azobacteroides sp.]|nr:hypothetical protein [Candidatus Azobacteroides sp.]
METAEQLICDTILQNPQKVTVNGHEYNAAPPTVATLIEVSKYISKIPDINVNEDGNVLTEVLSTADKCECFGDIAAILMLGKKNLITEKKYLFGLIKHKQNNQKKLASELTDNLSAEELRGLILEILKTLRVDFFFGISIFLKEINQLRMTKETEKTTASGRR